MPEGPLSQTAGDREIADSLRLLHELEVHQVELEAQNEELLEARGVAEKALERYTTLFDFAPIGYAALREDDAILEINHAGAGLLGHPRAQLVGKPFSWFFKDRVALRRVLETGRLSDLKQMAELTVAASVRTDEARYVRLTATSLVSEPDRLLVAFADVTEQRRREDQLRKSQEALCEANARKDDFLATLSHELRNPLAAIRSALSVQQRAAPGDERGTNASKVIGRQVTHLTRLVDDLLDVTRIARGKVLLHREPIELRVFLERTVEDHKECLDWSGVSIGMDLGSGEIWVNADPARLLQTVSNVIGNAEKFTPRGGRIDVTLVRDGESAVVRVRDTGAGVPPDLVGRVFEAFAQAPQTLERARGGLGLGLSTVKGLVELHGGTVTFSSAGVGRGSEVVIRLPLGKAPTHSMVVPALGGSGARRILVVEDNADAAAVLCDELALTGHEVTTAPDGPTAIEVARRFGPDIVFCDIGLPGMNGYEVARAIRRDPDLQHLFLVALSGYAQPEDRQRAAEAGFDRHAAKPIGFDELDRLVAEAPRRGSGGGSDRLTIEA